MIANKGFFYNVIFKSLRFGAARVGVIIVYLAWRVRDGGVCKRVS